MNDNNMPTLRPPAAAVHVACEELIRSLATLPAYQQPGWISYLLEGMNANMNNVTYVDMLAQVQDAIEVRIATGGWLA